MIEGNNPGWVFADDLNTPMTALVWAQGIEGFYLVGDRVLSETSPAVLGLHGRECGLGPIGTETWVCQEPHVYVVQFSTMIVRACGTLTDDQVQHLLEPETC